MVSGLCWVFLASNCVCRYVDCLLLQSALVSTTNRTNLVSILVQAKWFIIYLCLHFAARASSLGEGVGFLGVYYTQEGGALGSRI